MNIKTLFSTAMVFPMSTANAEHLFSNIAQIKGRLHDIILSTSLKLMIISCRRPTPLAKANFDAGCGCLWKSMTPRKILL